MSKIKGPKLQIGADTRDVKRKIRDLRAQFKRMTVDVKDVFKKAAAGTAVLSTAIAYSIKKYHEQYQAEVRLSAAIRAVGKESSISADAVKEMAKELQRSSTFGDEAALGAAALGISLGGLSQEQIPRFLTLSADFATMMGKDLPAAAQQLSKYLAVPSEGVSRLAQAGVSLTEETKDMIRTMAASGNLAGAQAALFGALEDKFRGTAEAAIQGTGIYRQTTNLIGDFIENIGRKAHTQMLAVTEAVRDLFLALNKSQATADTIAYLLASLFKLGAFVTVLAAIKIGWFAATAAAKIFFLLLRANPIGVLVTAIAALVTAFVPFKIILASIKEIFASLKQIAFSAIYAIGQVASAVGLGILSVVDFVLAGIEKFANGIAVITTALSEFTGIGRMAARKAETDTRNAFRDYRRYVGDASQQLMSQMKENTETEAAFQERTQRERHQRWQEANAEEVEEIKLGALDAAEAKAQAAAEADQKAIEREAQALEKQKSDTELARQDLLRRNDMIAYYDALLDQNNQKREEAKAIVSTERRTLRLEELGYEYAAIEQQKADHIAKVNNMDDERAAAARDLVGKVGAIEEGAGEATVEADRATKLATLKSDLATKPQEAYGKTSAAYPAPIGQIFGAIHAAVVTAAIVKGIVGAKRRYMFGGYVHGSGGTDSVVARLTPGELVLPRGTAAQVLDTVARNAGTQQQAQASNIQVDLNMDGDLIAQKIIRLDAGTRA